MLWQKEIQLNFDHRIFWWGEIEMARLEEATPSLGTTRDRKVVGVPRESCNRGWIERRGAYLALQRQSGKNAKQ